MIIVHENNTGQKKDSECKDESRLSTKNSWKNSKTFHLHRCQLRTTVVSDVQCHRLGGFVHFFAGLLGENDG